MGRMRRRRRRRSSSRGPLCRVVRPNSRPRWRLPARPARRALGAATRPAGRGRGIPSAAMTAGSCALVVCETGSRRPAGPERSVCTPRGRVCCPDGRVDRARGPGGLQAVRRRRGARPGVARGAPRRVRRAHRRERLGQDHAAPLLQPADRSRRWPSARGWRERGDGSSPVALRRRVGYVPQDGGLLPALARAAQRRAGALAPRARRRARGRGPIRAGAGRPRAGGRSARGGRASCPAASGSAWRVARALAADPDIVLLDEPFGALDAITRADLQATFAALRRELALTTLLVTHDLAEAALLADRIGGDAPGRVEQVGRTGRAARRAGDAIRARPAGAGPGAGA